MIETIGTPVALFGVWFWNRRHAAAALAAKVQDRVFSEHADRICCAALFAERWLGANRSATIVMRRLSQWMRQRTTAAPVRRLMLAVNAAFMLGDDGRARRHDASVRALQPHWTDYCAGQVIGTITPCSKVALLLIHRLNPIVPSCKNMKTMFSVFGPT